MVVADRLVARRVDRVVVRQVARPADLAVPTALLHAHDGTMTIAVRVGVMTMLIVVRVVLLMVLRRVRVGVMTTIAPVAAPVVVREVVLADALVDVPTIGVAVAQMVEAVADPRRDQVIAVSHPVVSRAKSASRVTRPNVAVAPCAPVARVRHARISNPPESNANPSSGSTRGRPCAKRRWRPPSAPRDPRPAVNLLANSTPRSRRPSKKRSNLVVPLD